MSISATFNERKHTNVSISTSLLEGYVDEPEASRQLKKHPRTLKRYRDQPDGLPHVKVGNRTLYRVEAVREWLLARERRPNPRRTSSTKRFQVFESNASAR
jgi:hypothetical protein